MSRDDLEREVHDYLDGRLTVPERDAFEKRVQADPELARRLQTYDAVRRALRDSVIDPPPGFYARARARFEERGRAIGPRRRWVSWEAVGLAAAALLVIAILLPPVWEERKAERLPGPPSAPSRSEPMAVRSEPPSSGADSNREAAVRRQEPVPVLPETEGAAAPGPALEPQLSPEDKTAAGRAKVDAPEPDSLGYVEAGPDETAPVLGAVRSRAVTDAPTEEPPASAQREFAPVPNTLKKTPSDDRAWGTPLPEGFFPAPRSAEKAGARASRAEGDREVIVIDDPETWDRVRGDLQLDGVAGGLSSHRLVLIGPRPEPVDCKALRWFREEREIVIELAAAAVSVPSPGGCALWIPAGNETVTFRREDP